MSDKVNDFIEEKTGVDLGVEDKEIALGIMIGSGTGALAISTILARDFYNNYRNRQAELFKKSYVDGALSVDDPREALSNQLIMRGHATMDEILQASFGEWPPKGLDIVTQNPQVVSFGDIADRIAEGIKDDHMIVWGDATLVDGRRIRMNHQELSEKPSAINRSAYTSTLGHEGAHILQGDNYYRAAELYGPQNSYEIWRTQQMVIGENDVVARVFKQHENSEYLQGLNEKALKHHGYLTSGIETQARVHEVIAGGYKEWGQVPTNPEEFFVAMKNAGINVPDEIMDEIKQSPTYSQTNRIFGEQTLYSQNAVKDLNKMQNGLTDEGRLALWKDAMPALYADWLEMVGDGPGRARMGLGTNIRPDLRVTYDPEKPPSPPPTRWIFDHSDNPDLRLAAQNLAEEQYHVARIKHMAEGGDIQDFRFDKERAINSTIDQYKEVQDIDSAISKINGETAQLTENRYLMDDYMEVFEDYYQRVAATLGTNPADKDMGYFYGRYLDTFEEGGAETIRIHMDTFNNITNDNIADYVRARTSLEVDNPVPLNYMRNRIATQGGSSLVNEFNEVFSRFNETEAATEPLSLVQRSNMTPDAELEGIVRDYMSERRQYAEAKYELRHGSLDGFEFDEGANANRIIRHFRRDDILTDAIEEYSEKLSNTTQRRQLLADYDEAYTRYHEMLTDITGADARDVPGTAIIGSYERTLENGGIDQVQNYIDNYNNVTPEDLRVYIQAETAIRMDNRNSAYAFDPNVNTITSPNAMRGSIAGHRGDEIFERIDEAIEEYNQRFPDREPLVRPSSLTASNTVEIETPRPTATVDAALDNVSPKASSAASEALQTSADLAKAAEGLQIGARAARMAKIGLVTTVAATAAGVALTGQAHAAQQDLASQFAEEGELINRKPGESDEAFTERTQEALQAYLDMNENVKNVVIGETVGNQTPLIGVLIGMAATEAYAKEQFDQWNAEFGPIDEDVFQALKMDMLGGQSLKGEFAMAGREMIPDTMSEFPSSLHGLWEAKQNLEHAEERAEMLVGRSRDPEQAAERMARHEERQEELEAAKAVYQEEFDRALSNPETAHELLALMPQDLLMEMMEATIENNSESANPVILEIMDLKAQSENIIEYGPGGYAAKARIEERITALQEENPDVFYDYIREVFGGVDVAEDQPNAADPDVENDGRFAAMELEEKSAVIAALTEAAISSEELRAAHPYIREIAELTSRGDHLEQRLSGTGRINQSNKIRMERESGEIEERLDVIHSELLENPDILEAAAQDSEFINDLLGVEDVIVEEPALIAQAEIPEGPFDGVAGDASLLAEAQEAGINVDPSILVQEQRQIAAASVGLATPQV